jgi:hypothetical protein
MAAPTLQSAGPGNIDELLTTSLVNLIPGIKDTIFKSNPVLEWLYKGKNKMRTRGGVSLSHGVLYGTNTTAQSYQRFDPLDVTPQDGMTRDQWNWAQYAVTVAIDGFNERVANAGDSKIADIVEEKKFQAEESLSLLLEQHLFAAVPGSKDIRSLATIVATSGTEGQISPTGNTWWQAQTKSSGAFSTQGIADLTTLMNAVAIQNPSGLPEMLVSDQTTFEYYEKTQTTLIRYVDERMADAGFTNLKFKGVPWTWSPQATSAVIYALHSSALEFAVNTDTDFLVKPFVESINQDARVAKILLACSLMTGNRRKLGKMTAITA